MRRVNLQVDGSVLIRLCSIVALRLLSQCVQLARLDNEPKCLMDYIAT